MYIMNDPYSFSNRLQPEDKEQKREYQSQGRIKQFTG